VPQKCISESPLFKHNQQDATLHNGIYYYKFSTGFRRFTAHHQELKTAEKARQISDDVYTVLAPDDGRRNRLKHIEN
jgi:hypothetical protein